MKCQVKVCVLYVHLGASMLVPKLWQDVLPMLEAEASLLEKGVQHPAIRDEAMFGGAILLHSLCGEPRYHVWEGGHLVGGNFSHRSHLHVLL